jgi:type IV pilus assembly protein PilA
MRKVQKGFTLIELMIVVAIIGILAAVAIPAYQDYTIRAKVTEGLSLASSAKTAVSEYFGTNGDWPAYNTSAGLSPPASIAGNSVRSVTVTNGIIEIEYSASGDPKIDGMQMSLTPTSPGGQVVWECGVGSVSGTALEGKWRPSSCR